MEDILESILSQSECCETPVRDKVHKGAERLAATVSPKGNRSEETNHILI